MKKYFHLLFLALLFSCQEPEIQFPDKSGIVGLATPIRLNLKETDIMMEDYFTDLSIVDSVSLPAQLSGRLSADKKILHVEKTFENLLNLMVLKVWSKGFPYAILIKKSTKLNYLLTFDPKGKTYQQVNVTGEVNGWNPKVSPMEFQDGRWKINMELFPGKYQYQLVLDGKGQLNPNNPDSVDNNLGGYNSLLKVGENNTPLLPVLTTKSYEENLVAIYIKNKINNVYVFWQNYQIPMSEMMNKDNTLVVSIPKAARKIERSWLRIWSENEFGTSNDLLIPLDKGSIVSTSRELTREDWEATVFYFMMIDRFNNGNPVNDQKVDDPQILPKVNYYGGDIAGITQKIRDGYFSDLGINTIWLSPISQNPLEAYGFWPNPPTKFSGYHGYWPISSSKVDFRYGTDAELKELIETAHKNDINIVLDYVAHHVHELHPAYIHHPDWATDLYLPDGSMNTERWDEYRLTTWFDKFLPTLDLSRPEICDVMTDSALFWIKNYNMDGFRHDATKHIPEIFWRTLTKKLKQDVAIPQNKRIYQVGETYGNRELIGSYISTGMMDAQFDFGVYDQAFSVFAKDNESFTKLSGSLQESLDYYGYHNLMGYISGNQDKSRFISLAGGSLKFGEDSKMAGWLRDIEVGDPIGYKKLQCFTAFNMTIPGIPTIYYGDEFGMPGANDPDNRRMMKFDRLSPEEQQTKDITEKLVHLRRDKLPLTFGDYQLLLADQNTYAFVRTYFDKIAVVVFNKNTEAMVISVILPEWFSNTTLEANFGSEFTKEGKEVMVTLASNSFEVLTN
jgi:cyclomaltodextrinase / maltogenic alpha-amylase / neopullulanase